MSESIKIEVTVKNQKLKLETNIKSLVAGAADTVYFHFTLTDEWDGLTTYAKFTQDGQDHIILLDESNEVVFPGYALDEGFCELTLHGAAQDNERFRIATTNCLYLKIEEDRTLGKVGGQSVEIKDAWDELLRRISFETKELSSLAKMPQASWLDFDYLSTVIRPYSVLPGEDLNGRDYNSRLKKSGTNLVEATGADGEKPVQGTPSEPQGILHVERDAEDNDYVLVFYAPSYQALGGWAPKEDAVLVQEFKFTPNHTSSRIIREQYVYNLGHANATGYNPKNGRVYATICGYKDPALDDASSTTRRPSSDEAIARLTYNKLFDENGQKKENSEKEPIFTTNEASYLTITDNSGNIIPNFTSAGEIAYNKESGALPSGLYMIAGNGKVHRYNDGKLDFIFDASQVEGKHFIYQDALEGMAVKGNYLFLSTHKPNVIYVYDCSNIIEGDSSTVKLAKIYNIPYADEYGHVMRFPEDLDYCPETEDFFMNIWCGLNKAYYQGPDHIRACYVYRFNLKTNSFSATRTPESGIQASNDTIYASNHEYHKYDDSGLKKVYFKGTKSYPFSTLGEALYAIGQYKDGRVIRVNSVPNSNWPEHVKTWGRDFTLVAQDTKEDYSSDVDSVEKGTLRVRGMQLLDGNYRFEQGITITGKNQYTQPLRIYNSSVNFDGDGSHTLVLGKSEDPENYESLRVVGSTLSCRYEVKGKEKFSKNEWVAKFVNSIVNAAFTHANLAGKFVVNKTNLLRANTFIADAQVTLEAWGRAFVYKDDYEEWKDSSGNIIETDTHPGTKGNVLTLGTDGNFKKLPYIILNDFTGFIALRIRMQYDFDEDGNGGTKYTLTLPAYRMGSSDKREWIWTTWFGRIKFTFTTEREVLADKTEIIYPLKGTYEAVYFNGDPVSENDLRVDVIGFLLE